MENKIQDVKKRPKSPFFFIGAVVGVVSLIVSLYNELLECVFWFMLGFFVLSLVFMIFKGYFSELFSKIGLIEDYELAREWIEDFSVILFSLSFIFTLVYINFIMPSRPDYSNQKIEAVFGPIINKKIAVLLPTIQNSSLLEIETAIGPIIDDKVASLLPNMQNTILATDTPFPYGYDATQVGDKFVGEFLYFLNNKKYKDNEILLPFFCEGDGKYSAYSRFEKFFTEKYIIKYPDTNDNDFDTSYSCNRDIVEESINDKGMYWEFELKLQCAVSYEGGNFGEEDHLFNILILKPTEKRQSYCIHEILVE